jgi:hypothetical protein
VETPSQHASIRGRILRCAVVLLRPANVHYRAAIQFDSYLPWFVEADDEYVVHGAGAAGQAAREDATPQVV